MSALVYRLETGYHPEESSSKMNEDLDELREEAERIVARYDDVMHLVIDLYRMAWKIAGDPV